MSAFKAGDRVELVHAEGFPILARLVGVGALGTVVRASGTVVAIRFDRDDATPWHLFPHRVRQVGERVVTDVERILLGG